MENTMKNYTAITIGPIYETMQLARSTKAIWSASYLFSFIMRELLVCVKAKSNLKVILPFSEEIKDTVKFDEEKYPKDTNDEILPAGLFPDHLLIEGEWEEKDFEECREEILKKINESFVEELKDLKQYDGEDIQERVSNFLIQHLQIRRVCVDLDEEKDNHIFELDRLCETAELFNTTNPHAKETFLSDYFEKYKTTVKKAEYNDVVRKNFKEKGRPFKSTAEIATAEFEDKQFYQKASNKYIINQEEEESDEEKQNSFHEKASEKHIIGNYKKTKEQIGYDTQNAFYNDIKTGAKNRFKFYHKYMAIVQADGDGVGGLIEKIYEKDSSKIEEFSKSLLAFSVKATQEILAYNGSAVYAGGDDLLFFAPVAHTDEKGKTTETILDLIREIDKIFKEQILKNSELSGLVDELETKPTMSYGVHIAYYKFPLDQALENAWSLLVDKAKKEDGKNAIALKVIKHSGQVFETILKKKYTFKKKLEGGTEEEKDALQEVLKKSSVEDSFISNFMYKLSPLSELIKSIGQILEEDKRNERFDAFFENYFNEEIHKNNDFLATVKDLLQTIYTQNPLKGESKEEKHQKNIHKLYAILRFYQFINAKSE